MVIATPDVGGTKRASAYSKFLGCPMVICYKLRKKANEYLICKLWGCEGNGCDAD